MSKKISEIYTEYKIMPNLQQHMIRVAAVASLICDNFTEPLPKNDIVTACLLHDMGNIIKFDLKQTQNLLNGDLDLDYWQKVKNEYIEKYGTNEHQATLKIIKEFRVSEKVSDYVASIDFFEIFKTQNKLIEALICMYSDCRVDPYGIVSVEGRLLEGKNRYKNRTKITDEKWEMAKNIFLKIQDQIFSKCKIKPEDINNEAIAPIISSLKDFVIK